MLLIICKGKYIMNSKFEKKLKKTRKSIDITAVSIQRELFDTVKKRIPTMDSFVLTMKRDFYDVPDVLESKNDVDFMYMLIREASIRLNGCLSCTKDEALKMFLMESSEDEQVMLYAAFEYYANMNEDNKHILKALKMLDEII